MSDVIVQDTLPENGVKSLDKLEIQLEEQNVKVVDLEAETAAVQNGSGGDKEQDSGGSNGAPKVAQQHSTPKGAKTKSTKLSLLKFPPILRNKRPADVSSLSLDKDKTESSVKGQVTNGGSPMVNPKTANGTRDTSSVHPEVPTSDEGPPDTVVAMDTTATPLNSPSFLSAFSTPRWTNFRRVFSSFNRSTPAPLAQEEVDLDGSVVQTPAVTVDMPDDAKECEKVGNGGNARQTNLISPLLSLFKSTKTLEQQGTSAATDKHLPLEQEEKTVFEKKLDSAVTPQTASLPDKTNKSEQQVQSVFDESGAQMEQIASQKSPKEQEIEIKTNLAPTLNGNGVAKGGAPWRSTFLGSCGNRKKVAVATLSGFLIVLAGIVVMLACQPNRAIDIGSLVIDGKFINTMTSCGQVQGILEDGGYAFRGIPYAVPPIGELRWRPAQLHSHLSHCWNGTYNATKSKLPCWQFYRNGNYDGSEDCLYLDVLTPKPYYDSPLPVVVFIGGESLSGGESADVKPTTKLSADKSVVFVSVSIRRSVLGFLTVEALSRNSYPMTSGNYGLSDLLAALHWVKLNAQHFGGDPNHVTLLGHQSGSSLILALLTTHVSKGLFHQVWVSGGSPPTALLTVQEAEAQNEKYMKELGCTSIECLHNKGPEELLEFVPNHWRIFHQDLPNRAEKRHRWLVRDGLILRDTSADADENVPLSHLPADSLIKIPFVAGAAAEVDASPEMFSYLDWNDTSKFSTYLESSLGTFGPSLPREVMDRYFRPESTPWQTFASLLSDVRTICPLYYTALGRADPYVKMPVYFYVATQRKMTSIGFVGDTEADIRAILGLYEAGSREERKFVQNMQSLFYNFVEKGELSEEMQDVTKSIVKVDESVQKIYTYPNCDFWQQQNFFPNHSRVD